MREVGPEAFKNCMNPHHVAVYVFDNHLDLIEVTHQ